MRLDRYDAAATAATALAGAAYVAHRMDWAFLAGPRVAAFAVLAAGLGACVANGSRPGYTPAKGAYGAVASALGAGAMVFGLLGITLGAEVAIAVTLGITVLMWAVTTTRNARTEAAPTEVQQERRELTSV